MNYGGVFRQPPLDHLEFFYAKTVHEIGSWCSLICGISGSLTYISCIPRIMWNYFFFAVILSKLYKDCIIMLKVLLVWWLFDKTMIEQEDPTAFLLNYLPEVFALFCFSISILSWLEFDNSIHQNKLHPLEEVKTSLRISFKELSVKNTGLDLLEFPWVFL